MNPGAWFRLVLLLYLDKGFKIILWLYEPWSMVPPSTASIPGEMFQHDSLPLETYAHGFL